MSEELAMKIAQVMAEAEFNGMHPDEVEIAYEDAHGMWIHGGHPVLSDDQEQGRG